MLQSRLKDKATNRSKETLALASTAKVEKNPANGCGKPLFQHSEVMFER